MRVTFLTADKHLAFKMNNKFVYSSSRVAAAKVHGDELIISHLICFAMFHDQLVELTRGLQAKMTATTLIYLSVVIVFGLYWAYHQ